MLDASFEGWVVERTVAASPTSIVALVVDPSGRRGALKTLPPGGGHLLRSRFARELKAISALDHPRIPQVLDHGGSSADDRPWFVTEQAPGRTLSETLGEGAPADALVVAIAEQIGDALAYSHDNGVTHRDLSPQNIVCDANAAYLIDFGIAAVGGSPDLTTDGTMLGTVAYCAPEQLERPGTSTPSVDLYGLAACLFAVVTGVPPHPGATVADILRRRALGSRRQLAAGTDQAREAAALIEAALAEDPLARPPDIRQWSQQVADALEALPGPLRQHFVVATTGITVATQPPPSFTARPWQRFGAIGAAALATVSAAVFWPTAPARQPERLELRATPDRVTLPASWAVSAARTDGSVRAFNPADGISVDLLAHRAALQPEWTTTQAKATVARGRPALIWTTARTTRVAWLGTTGATIIECSGRSPRLAAACTDLLSGADRSDATPMDIGRLAADLRALLSPLAHPWTFQAPAAADPAAAHELRRRADDFRRVAKAIDARAKADGYGWLMPVAKLRQALSLAAAAAAHYADHPSLAGQRRLKARVAAARRAARQLARVVAVPLPAPARARPAPAVARNAPADTVETGGNASPPVTGQPAPNANTSPATRSQPATTPRPSAPSTQSPAVEEPVVIGPAL